MTEQLHASLTSPSSMAWVGWSDVRPGLVSGKCVLWNDESHFSVWQSVGGDARRTLPV